MGCGLSTPDNDGGGGEGARRKQGSVGDVVVFVPGLRAPMGVDLSQALAGRLDKSAVERLSALRARVVDMAMQESAVALKPRRKTAARHGSSTANLLQALEDYLPVLLGLVKEGSELRHSVQFVWTNQEDKAEVCACLPVLSPKFTSVLSSNMGGIFGCRRRPWRMHGTRCCPCCI
uniref:Uncharacterized protein n=1 Tax=Aegilops tauschii subsp. strangulata TaxID=200361 RepID=A0A453CGN2_AEGTS